jgi:hypothetical protein
VDESFKKSKKNPRYVAAYSALEEEFALASAVIKAREFRHDAGAGSPASATINP